MTTRSSNATETEKEPRPRLYLVATSHLDTQWRWTIQNTIRHFLKRTLLDNFERLRSYPSYVLSFEGAFRYQLIEEYYPREFQKLLEYVRSKRWHPAGAMLDAPDTNLPSAESLIRHILYGNDYFESKLGRRSEDIFLPDCFGFPWSLPTIASHCGLKGFSSQKFIKWMAPAAIPFDIGIWEGPDGSRIVAVLNPGGYGETLREDLSRSPHWRRRLERQRRQFGIAVGYKYFGLGDRGGAPDPTSLDYLEKSLANEGDTEVVHGGSDQLFRDLTAAERDRLPVHRGDLLLPTHGTGCWTSHAVLKKWNRRCELLGEAAERAALGAAWLEGQEYPESELRREWTRFLWHQMHDDLTGTSSPEAYRFTWNDLLLAQNRFSTLLTSSVATISRGLDTRTSGIPLVVFNCLGFDRRELADAWISFDSETSETPPAIRVIDPDGIEVPSQELEREGRRIRILFEASVPAVGLAVYQVISASDTEPLASELRITTRSLENHRYRVVINDDGAIESLYDKRLERELLEAPMDLALLPDRSAKWPAWEILYEDVCSPTQALDAPSRIRIVESGPVRLKLEITRSAGNSRFLQTVSLAAGEPGSHLEVEHEIDWKSPGKLLKAVFPVAVDQPTASYDMGLGSIERSPNTRSEYEVPAQEWADLSGPDWGLSILTRHKYGWDRPRANTLRLSLLRSPKALRKFAHQATQDFGRHRFAYAVTSHDGRPGARTAARAASFNQPLFPFQARPHDGDLGKKLSLFRVEGDGAHLMALKKAERSDHWLARVRETAGAKTTRVELRGPGPFESCALVDGCEQSPIAARPLGGGFELELPRFAVRSALLAPKKPEIRLPPIEQIRLPIEFDTIATSFHGQGGADFDGAGQSLPGELFPNRLRDGGLTLALGPDLPGVPNALACRGQRLQLPEDGFDHLTLVATSTRRSGSTVVFDGISEPIRIPYYSGFVGQWKRFSGRIGFLMRRWKSGFIERTPVAWVGSHRHDRSARDQVYTYCYLFLIRIELAAGMRSICLPAAPEVKIFAATAWRGSQLHLEPAERFYD